MQQMKLSLAASQYSEHILHSHYNTSRHRT